MWLRAIVTPGGRVVQGKLTGEHTHTDGSSGFPVAAENECTLSRPVCWTPIGAELSGHKRLEVNGERTRLQPITPLCCKFFSPKLTESFSSIYLLAALTHSKFL